MLEGTETVVHSNRKLRGSIFDPGLEAAANVVDGRERS
jgi:hypothetical protein